MSCVVKEVKIVKKIFKKEIITPGIRFTPKVSDQKRILTPNKLIIMEVIGQLLVDQLQKVIFKIIFKI